MAELKDFLKKTMTKSSENKKEEIRGLSHSIQRPVIEPRGRSYHPQNINEGSIKSTETARNASPDISENHAASETQQKVDHVISAETGEGEVEVSTPGDDFHIAWELLGEGKRTVLHALALNCLENGSQSSEYFKVQDMSDSIGMPYHSFKTVLARLKKDRILESDFKYQPLGRAIKVKFNPAALKKISTKIKKDRKKSSGKFLST